MTLIKIDEIPGVCTYWQFNEYRVKTYPNSQVVFVEAKTAKGQMRQIRAPKVEAAFRAALAMELA